MTPFLSLAPETRLLPGKLFASAIFALCAASVSANVPSAIGLNESFSVGPSGNVSYSVGIEVPPGPGGLMPSVTIGYSGGGNGAIGVGWNLSTGSMISRCSKIFGLDGEAGRIWHDADDRFCLDGQRLVKVGTGVYGADGTEYRTEIESNIRVFSYGGTTGNPNDFTAEYADGSVVFFGPRFDANNDTKSALRNSAGTTIHWAIRQRADPFGNQLRYYYFVHDGFQYPQTILYGLNPAAPSGFGSGTRIVRFEYKARYPSATGTDLRDTHYVYTAKHYRRTAYLLDKIKTEVWSGSAWTQYKQYRMTYDALGAVKASRLTKIEECSVAAPVVCKEASPTYHWDNNPWHFDSNDTAVTTTKLGPLSSSGGFGTGDGYLDTDRHPRQLADIDGDGFLDIVGFGDLGTYVAKNRASDQSGTPGEFNNRYLAQSQFGAGSGAGGWATQNQYPRVLADVNGDGKADILAFAANGLDVALSNGTSFGGSGGWSMPGHFGTATTNQYPNSTEAPRFVQDVNGDGRPDIVGLIRNQQVGNRFANVYVAINNGYDSNGNGSFATPTWQVMPIGGGGADMPLFMADMNLDGRSDIVHFFTDGVSIALSQGTSFAAPTLWTSQYASGPAPQGWPNDSVYPRTIGDVNGDGRPDLVAFSDRHVMVAINSGAGSFYASESWTLQFVTQNGFQNTSKHPRQLADVDGDGRADIVGFADNGVWVALSTGTKFEWARVRSAFEGTAGWNNESIYPRMLGDVSGDGFTDIVGLGGSVTLTSLNQGTPGDRVRVFDSGNGHWNLISRKPITDDNVHTKSTGANYPFVDMVSPVYVVDSVTTPSRDYLPSSKPTPGDVATATNSNHTEIVSFQYVGMRGVLNGRGSTSFEKVISTDDIQNSRIEREFSRMDYPLFGLLNSTKEFIRPTVGSSYTRLISQNDTVFNSDPPSTNPIRQIFVYEASSTTRSWMPADSTDVSTFVLASESLTELLNRDAYGFPQTVRETTGPVTSPAMVKTTARTFNQLPVANLWQLGQVSSETTSVAVPSASGTPSTYSRTTNYDYWPSGAIERVISDPGLIELQAETASVYDLWGNALQDTAQGANVPNSGTPSFGPWVTNRTYDVYGYGMVSETNPEGHLSEKLFDRAHGGALSATQWIDSSSPVIKTNSYDPLGRLSKATDPNGVTRFVEHYSYAPDDPGTSSDNYSAELPYAIGSITRATSSAVSQQIGPISIDQFNVLGEKIATVTQRFEGAGSSKWVRTDSVIRNADGTTQATYRPFDIDTLENGYSITEYDVLKRPKRRRVFNPNQASSGVTETVTDFAHYVLPNENVDGIAARTFRSVNTEDRVVSGVAVTHETYTNELGQVVRTVDGEGKELFRHFHASGHVEKHKIPAQVHVDDWSSSWSSPEVLTLTEFDARGRRTKLVEPNSGTWLYEYDAADRVVSQTNPDGAVSTMIYDSLGRKTSQTDGTSTRSWSYDNCSNGVGQLCQVTVSGGVGYSKSISYDAVARPTVLDYQVGSNNYTFGQSYDSVGRPSVLTYPGGFDVQNHYDPTFGSVTRISRVANPSTAPRETVWQAISVDHEGITTNSLLGNGINVITSLDRFVRNVASAKGVSGFGTPSQTDLYGWSYSYYNWGGLEYRTETTTTGPDNNAHWQAFTNYDRNKRIRGWYSAAINGGASYDSLGNLRWKWDASPGNVGGFYIYNAAVTSPNGNSRTIPNAVGEIREQNGWTVTTTMAYDQKAQLVNSTGRSITWNAFGKPSNIQKGSSQATLVYGPSDERVRQTRVTSSGTAITDYLNGPDGLDLIFESELSNGIRENRHYISAGGALVAVHNTYSGVGAPTSATNYLHSDMLGSVTAISNQSGTIVERLSYDPWGKRQFINGSSDPTNTLTGNTTDRGFTGHEHLDEVGLINMNGRIYDPSLARFMSPDLVAQEPASIQSNNRYSYVMNSPMAGTDPTGYFSFSRAFKAFGKAHLNPFRAQNVYGAIRSLPGQVSIDNYTMSHPWLRQTGHAVAGFFSFGFGSAVITGYEIYISGGTGSDIRKGVARSAAIAALSYGAGSIGNSYARVAAHAAVGCAAAKSQGGHCGRGAASAGVGAILSNVAGSDALSATLAGGITGRLSGGSFEDGAVAAFGAWLGNRLARGSAAASGRPLTEAEIAVAKKFFGDRVDYSSVRVVDGRFLATQWENYFMSPDGHIYAPGSSYCADYSSPACGTKIEVFVHEMAHVMQHQRGDNVLLKGALQQIPKFATFTLYDPYKLPAGKSLGELLKSGNLSVEQEAVVYQKLAGQK